MDCVRRPSPDDARRGGRGHPDRSLGFRSPRKCVPKLRGNHCVMKSLLLLLLLLVLVVVFPPPNHLLPISSPVPRCAHRRGSCQGSHFRMGSAGTIHATPPPRTTTLPPLSAAAPSLRSSSQWPADGSGPRGSRAMLKSLRGARLHSNLV